MFEMRKKVVHLMPIVKFKHPDKSTTFTFDWLPDGAQIKLIKRRDENNGDVWRVLTREKARLTWASLYRAGYRQCRCST